MQAIPLILFLLIFYFYFKNKPAYMLLCMTAVLNSCFGFVDSSYYVFKPTDMVLIPTILITVVESFKRKDYFGTRGDGIGRSILLLIIFLVLEFIRTAVWIDTPVWAFKVVRYNFIILLYFYLRRQNPQVFEQYFKIALVPSIIQGIFFYLQLVGINVLVGRVDEAETMSQLTRYANGPALASFYVIYYFLKEKDTFVRRVSAIVFFGFTLVLAQGRGMFLGMGAAFAVFFIIKHKVKYVGYIVIGYIVYSIFIAPIFAYRNTQGSGGGTLSDIQNVFSGDYTNIDASQGTFSFRIAMLMERWTYMENDPETIPFGIGCIHEQSPKNDYYFVIGTVNNDAKYGRVMIDSGDITWVPILLRYGLVGIFMFGFVLLMWIRTSLPYVNRINSGLFTVIALTSISTTILTVNTTLFDTASGNYSLALNLAIISSFISRYKLMHKNVNASKVQAGENA